MKTTKKTKKNQMDSRLTRYDSMLSKLRLRNNGKWFFFFCFYFKVHSKDLFDIWRHFSGFVFFFRLCYSCSCRYVHSSNYVILFSFFGFIWFRVESPSHWRLSHFQLLLCENLSMIHSIWFEFDSNQLRPFFFPHSKRML